MSFPVLITPNLQLYSKDNSYLEYLYSVQQSDFSWSYIKVWNSMQTVCTKEPVTIASVIHHMRKNTCTHPTTASHHYRHINRKRQISMSTYLRVPFSPLSRLVKRLYKRVIWLWETEGKKKQAHQWFLAGEHPIAPNYTARRFESRFQCIFFISFIAGNYLNNSLHQSSPHHSRHCRPFL